MKNMIRLLAKEVRRVRALVELMEKCGGLSNRVDYRKKELETLKRILGLMIKKELDK